MRTWVLPTIKSEAPYYIDIGENYSRSGYADYTIIGVNVPVLFQYDVSVLSIECGAQLDALTGEDGDKVVFNAGFVVGAGLRFGFARFFYRFNYGTGYYSQMFGIRMMF